MEGEWELSKENIQPRKEGRDINSLIAGLTPRKDAMLQKANEMRNYEQAIRKNDGPDPLENWYKYLIWTEQNFPDGGSLEVKKILERCIQHFEEQERYKNDERYIKIWLKYADIIQEPVEVFNYMHDKSIGALHTPFYENWAEVLECAGNYQKADEVYQLGIARNAQPIARLQRLHESFMKRLAAKVKDDIDDAPQPDDVHRTSLATLKKAKDGKVGHDRIKAKSGRPTVGLKLQTTKKQIQGGSIKVFEDENALLSKVPAAAGEWKEPPVNSKIRKENAQKPAKWTSSKISTGAISRSAQPTFMIHEDEGLETKQDRTPKQIVMNYRKPLSSRKASEMEPSSNPIEAIKKKDDCQFEVKYCKAAVYLGNSEYSLEELRALQPKYAVDPAARDNCTVRILTDMEETCVQDTEIKDNVYYSDINAFDKPKDETRSMMERLQAASKLEKSASSRQRLNFSNTIVKEDDSKVSFNETVKPNTTVVSDDMPNVIQERAPPDFDSSSLGSLDDMEDFIGGPVESTSKHDMPKLPHRLPPRFEGIRDVLRDSEITKIESKYDDCYMADDYHGPTESTGVYDIPLGVQKLRNSERALGKSLLGNDILSDEDIKGDQAKIVLKGAERKNVVDLLAKERNMDANATFAFAGPDVELHREVNCEEKPAKIFSDGKLSFQTTDSKSSFRPPMLKGTSRLQASNSERVACSGSLSDNYADADMSSPGPPLSFIAGPFQPIGRINDKLQSEGSTEQWIQKPGYLIKPKVKKPDDDFDLYPEKSNGKGNDCEGNKLAFSIFEDENQPVVTKENGREKSRMKFPIFQDGNRTHEKESNAKVANGNKMKFPIFQDSSKENETEDGDIMNKMTFPIFQDNDPSNVGRSGGHQINFPSCQDDSTMNEMENKDGHRLKFPIFEDENTPSEAKNEIVNDEGKFSVFQDENLSNAAAGPVTFSILQGDNLANELGVRNGKSDRKVALFPAQDVINDINDSFAMTFKKPSIPKQGLQEKTSCPEKDIYDSGKDQYISRQLKRQPPQQLTPASNAKMSHLHGVRTPAQLPPKSPLWAPSPTFHTKLATQAIHEMWRANDFTLNMTINASNNFEQQFADETVAAPQDRFKIFEDEFMAQDKENDLQMDVKRNEEHDHMHRHIVGNQTAGQMNLQQMSISNGRLEYTITDQLASSVTAQTSTPCFLAEPCPKLSCTAIGSLHDSETQQGESTQQMTCESKNLSTIQEQSGESSSDTPKKSSSSSRGFSEGSNSSIDMSCPSTSKHVQSLPPVFANDDFSKVDKIVASPEELERSSARMLGPAETSHVEVAFNTLSLNTASANAASADKPVNASTTLTTIVSLMDFEMLYSNLKLENHQPLNERFISNSKVNLGEDQFKIVKKIAVGGFATVFSACNLNEDDEEETALKVMKSPELCQWEFHIGKLIHKRLEENNIDPKLHECFIEPLSGYVYSNGAVIQYPFHTGGTLLDLVNKHLKERVGQTDTFALLYGLNVCKIVKAMHDCSILHGDVKPDNFLLKRISGSLENPCELNCLTLADFGRCLDLTLYSEGTTFTGSCNTDKFECIEMRKNMPWKYQIDYYGVACTIHVVLHGSYLECFSVDDKYRPLKVASRRLGKEFWASVFDRLLNVSDCHDQTVLEGIIKGFEERLADPERQKALTELLNFHSAMTAW